MTVLLGALASLCFGQVVGIAETTPSERQDRPYKFIMQDGSAYVGFPSSDNWERARNINVRLDAPWDGNPNVRIDVGAVDRVKSVFERESEWRQRHETNWTERGYVDLDETEAYYWVPKTEVALADRARAMAAAEPEVVEATPAATTAESERVAGPAADQPGFLTLWGPHVAVVTAALALSAAAVWFFQYRQ